MNYDYECYKIYMANISMSQPEPSVKHSQQDKVSDRQSECKESISSNVFYFTPKSSLSNDVHQKNNGGVISGRDDIGRLCVTDLVISRNTNITQTLNIMICDYFSLWGPE